jgi:hypothetical protein
VTVAALLLSILASPNQVEVGPFVIESSVVREKSSPYYFDSKVTMLRWKSPSGMMVYRLLDDGETVRVSYEVSADNGVCLAGANTARLTARPRVQFRVKCELLDAARSKLLKAEMRSARRYFMAAYVSFYKATLHQHGSSLQRCRETRFGYHGPICATYWDEGRSATSQQMHKRTN